MGTLRSCPAGVSGAGQKELGKGIKRTARVSRGLQGYQEEWYPKIEIRDVVQT